MLWPAEAFEKLAPPKLDASLYEKVGSDQTIDATTPLPAYTVQHSLGSLVWLDLTGGGTKTFDTQVMARIAKRSSDAKIYAVNDTHWIEIQEKKSKWIRV